MDGATECLTQGCGTKASLRGLCKNCYQQAYYLISTGRETWAALEKSGRALKPNPGNRGKFRKSLDRPAPKRKTATVRRNRATV